MGMSNKYKISRKDDYLQLAEMKRGIMRDNNWKEDFYFLYTELLKHPSLIDDAQRKNRFDELYYSKSEGLSSFDSFINEATELTMFFHDGHTNIEVPYTTQDRCIPLHCMWDEQDSDNLILSEEYEEIPANAKIIAINGISVSEIILRLSQRIPHENMYLVKSRMLAYPYQNYHLFSEMNLKWLFGLKENYDISFLVNGKIIKKQCAPTYYDGLLDFADENDFISYKIQDNKMILSLNACILNDKYKMVLETAAKLCSDQEITSFVLDLSHNMGGNSAVIDEFIKYTNVDTFKRYEMIDYSSGEAKKLTSRDESVKNLRKPICFPAEMYCKVSQHTFSSARTFAVTLKDNGIARIIGTPTGGKPNSYGMPRRLQTPNYKLRFRVSTSYFLRPNDDLDDAITLEPDE